MMARINMYTNHLHTLAKSIYQTNNIELDLVFKDDHKIVVRKDHVRITI